MPLGAGKYDDLCSQIREQTQATGVLIVVFNGNFGNGFSAQIADPLLLARLPQVLREVAKKIEDSYANS